MATKDPATTGAAEHKESLSEHFNHMSAQYDDIIRRTFPHYREAFDSLFEFTAIDRNLSLDVLELGVGTGNLTLRTAQAFPKAHFTLLDLSPEMLKVTQGKLNAAGIQGCNLVEAGFMDAEFPENSFDLITSSIALHHLTNEEKPLMYERIFRWLKPGGKFRCIDGHQTLPAATAHETIWEAWIRLTKPLGATDEEIAMWRQHEEDYDHFATLYEHFQWLEAAGFTEVDCYWKKLLWAIWGGEKPSRQA